MTENANPVRAYSFQEAAAALRISRVTLWRRVKSGAIKAVPVTERKRVIPAQEIERILNPAA